MDPRRFDLMQLLAAYEFTLKQGCKDEAAWRRIHGQIYAEPKEVREERRAATVAAAQSRRAAPAAATGGRMSVDDAEAMLARFAATDARFGAA